MGGSSTSGSGKKKIKIKDRIKELRRVPAGQLVPNPKNWRTHPKAQQDALRGVLSEIGYADALLARETDAGLMLLDGHLRAETTPDSVVPVLVLDVDEAEADKLLATLDPLAAMAEADKAKLDALLKDVQTDSEAVETMLKELAEASGIQATVTPGAGGDEFDTSAALEGECRAKWGDLWLVGGVHRVLCGDSTCAEDVAKVMGGEKAEMVWTDPPYGVSIGDKNKFLNSIAPCNRVEEPLRNDSLDEPELAAMLHAAFGIAAEHCTAGAAWYVAAPAVPLHLLFAQAMKDLGILRQMLVWVKNNATFSPMGVSYHWRHEPIFYGWLPNAGHRYHGDRKQETVWEIDRPTASPEHPTMKPVDLVTRAIQHSSLAKEIILDPFLGSGTTLIAAHRTGRRCYGIEIEPKYVEVILRRAEAEGLAVERLTELT